MHRLALVIAGLLAGTTVSQAQQTPDPRVADIVQAGKLRAALFLPQYAKDSATGELRGIGMGLIALELARSLAARLAVELVVVEQPTPPKAVECLNTGACDVMFLGIEPSRVGAVDFTPAFAQFDYTYLVPAGSPITSIADADRTGGHIATVGGHAAAIVLGHTVKHAEIVAADIPDAAFDLLRSGKADAFALPREQLLYFSTKLAGSRVLEDAYGVNRTGMAVRKGQAGRLSYVGEFLDDAKASGTIQRVIDRDGLRGFQVSPRGSAATE
jgi:polar amino acid transport system substrate-binding protein